AGAQASGETDGGHLALVSVLLWTRVLGRIALPFRVDLELGHVPADSDVERVVSARADVIDLGDRLIVCVEDSQLIRVLDVPVRAHGREAGAVHVQVVARPVARARGSRAIQEADAHAPRILAGVAQALDRLRSGDSAGGGNLEVVRAHP